MVPFRQEKLTHPDANVFTPRPVWRILHVCVVVQLVPSTLVLLTQDESIHNSIRHRVVKPVRPILRRSFEIEFLRWRLLLRELKSIQCSITRACRHIVGHFEQAARRAKVVELVHIGAVLAVDCAPFELAE